MPFSLTIVEGKDQGRQFTFDQPEVLIGRTAENDVVLYDPGVSRRHVKIREDGGRYRVEDLGSANGTQLNGVTVAEEELKEGDAIGVGPVVFTFSAGAAPERAAAPQGPKAFGPARAPPAGGSNRIVGSADVRPKVGLKRERPAGATGPDLEVERGTVRRPAVGTPVARPGGPAGRPGSATGPRPGSALARPGPAASKPDKAKSATMARRDKGGAVSVGSFARGARRESPIARAREWLSSRPKTVRLGIFGGAGLVGLLVVVGVISSVAGGSRRGARFEADEQDVVFALGNQPDPQVYGLGPGVHHRTTNHAKFKFPFPVPTGTKAVATLYYYARAIERPDEVQVILNTVPIGTVPTVFGDFDKMFTQALKTRVLLANQDNLIVFDSTRNPPNREEWAITGLRVDVTELPQCTRDECLRGAKQLMDLCTRKFDQIRLGAANGFNAWQECKKARLHLEAVDDHEKLDIYALIQDLIKDIDRKLGEECGRQILMGRRLEQIGSVVDAVKTWKGGLAYFPSAEHPCHFELKELIGQYE